MNYTSKGFLLPEGSDFFNVDHANQNAQKTNDLIEDLEDGTTAAGNASNLGGNSPDYYAKVNDVGNKAALSTEDKTNLVAAINEVKEQNNNLGAYAVASGTNTYIATISGYTLVEGQTVRIKFTNANTGASTLNINGLGAKSILKGNGNALSSGNIKAGQICNLVYGGVNFQFLGEGGEYGTAVAGDVLATKTIGTEEGLIDGTMPNRGAVNQNLTTEGQEYTIPLGYHNGLGKIKAVITGLVASVLKAGTTVGGILGTFTSDATATAAQMLAGAKAYVNGVLVTGTIPSKGAQTYTPLTTNQTITANQYLSGNQTILGSTNLLQENIKNGVNIFGITGNLSPVNDTGIINPIPAADTGTLATAVQRTLPVNGSFNDILSFINFHGSATSISSNDYVYVRERGQIVTTKTKNYNNQYGNFSSLIVYNPSKATVTLNKATETTLYSFIQ